MVRVKICGTTNEEDVDLCVRLGVDALGFVVEYPIPVPWNLKVEQAGKLMERVPPFVSRVCVVGDDYEKVLEIATVLRPDAIQLHGNETLDETKQLIAAIKALKIKVIKAVRFSSETDRVVSEVDDPVKLCTTLQMMGVDAIVLDAATGSMPGGTGRKINWHLAATITKSLSLPVILAGGLNPENLCEAISRVRPYAVDVLSGVELSPGEKDPAKVRDLLYCHRSLKTFSTPVH